MMMMALNSSSKNGMAYFDSAREFGEEDIDKSSLDSLPNDIVSNILHRLPAQFLYKSAKLVCKTWAEILQLPCFINSHLHHSESDHGFLIQQPRSPYNAQFVHTTRDWKIQVKDLNLKFPGKISGSSDGFLLINRRATSSSVVELYVANPITMQVLKLPSLPQTCTYSGHCNNITSSISSTGEREIKVLSLGREPNGMYNWFVLTVGKAMSWRKISSNIAAESQCDPASYLSYVQSLSVDGVIYWTNFSWISNGSILAFDLHHSETAHHLKLPVEVDGGEYWTLVQMGNQICCMTCGKNVEMKVWLLKDLSRNEWAMVRSITFSTESPLKDYFCIPLLWLDSQVVIFSVYVEVNNAIVAYNVNKNECQVIKVDGVARYPIFLHSNTLRCF
ncbi:hypothetical protein L6164_017026 [Bauhinia variegata]|uniref:Uncharacterized protein n=1 Tax=Bauhinia variegata TaxID=167791 RepID=A0ACB9N8K0_BAUVA|nr:hypothetical protein L6164_017026 [Bauhinia variegata]